MTLQQLINLAIVDDSLLPENIREITRNIIDKELFPNITNDAQDMNESKTNLKTIIKENLKTKKSSLITENTIISTSPQIKHIGFSYTTWCFHTIWIISPINT